MTDTDTAAQETQQGESGGEDPKGLRKQLEAAQAEIKELKTFKRTTAFKEAGFDPDSGYGKALARTFEGEPTPEAIREYAKNEYGWEPEQTQAAPERTEAETQREQAQGRADQVTASSTSVEPPDDLQGQIAKAEADGDWQTAGALKSQLLNKMHYQR